MVNKVFKAYKVSRVLRVPVVCKEKRAILAPLVRLVLLVRRALKVSLALREILATWVQLVPRVILVPRAKQVL